MTNRYKAKEGGTMIPLRFQNGGSNLFLTMPDGGNVGSFPYSPMGLPEYQTGTNFGGVYDQTMADFNHNYSPGYPMMAEGGDTDMDDGDQTFYTNRMNTFIQKIRDAAERNLETAVMEQDQEQPMARYGMNMQDQSMNMYDPGNYGAFQKAANYTKGLANNALSGYVQRMGALGPNDYYYKEKNIYKDTSKEAPLGTQTFTDADGNESMISPEEAYNRANYAGMKREGGSLPRAQDGMSGVIEGTKEGARLVNKANDVKAAMMRRAPKEGIEDMWGGLAPADSDQEGEYINKYYATRQGPYPSYVKGNGIYDIAGYADDINNKLGVEAVSGVPYKAMPIMADPYGYMDQNQIDYMNQFEKANNEFYPNYSTNVGELMNFVPKEYLDPDNIMKKGGSLTKYQQDINSGQPGTTGTANNTAPTATQYKSTVINGVEYPVGPDGRVYGYTPQPSTGPYPNYQPQYNRYSGYNGYGRGRNLGVISKDKLTKDFREQMQAGSYGNPQLLGLSGIETRRAFDPGNRIKSMTFSYGQPIPGGRTTVNQPAANNSTPGKSSSTAPTGTNSNAPSTSVNPSVSNLTPEQKIQQATDFTFRPGQGPYNTTLDFPGLEKPRVGPWDVDNNIIGTPYPNKDQSTFNRDPNNTGGTLYSNIDPSYDDIDNISDLADKMYADQGYVKNSEGGWVPPETDPRGANYGKEDYPEDLVLPEAGKVVKGSDGNFYVKMPDGTIQKSIKREVLRKKTGFAKGGSLHKFMKKYQGDVGPSSVRDMTIADLPDDMDYIGNPFVMPESNNAPMEFKPYEMTDADRVRAVDAGTEYDQLESGDGMAPSFDVTTKRRKKRIGNPYKDLAAIDFATGLFNSRNAAVADTEMRNRSTASNMFNPMRDFEGDYDILSGDFRKGSRAAGGNDKFHSGFGTYAQMGGSMLDGLKEGDEVYLTEEQINDIVKRGGKLSYL